MISLEAHIVGLLVGRDDGTFHLAVQQIAGIALKPRLGGFYRHATAARAVDQRRGMDQAERIVVDYVIEVVALACNHLRMRHPDPFSNAPACPEVEGRALDRGDLTRWDQQSIGRSVICRKDL